MAGGLNHGDEPYTCRCRVSGVRVDRRNSLLKQEVVGASAPVGDPDAPPHPIRYG